MKKPSLSFKTSRVAGGDLLIHLLYLKISVR
jgi:hypothetical protein